MTNSVTHTSSRKNGYYYGGRSVISPRGELWRAIADLLSERSGKKISIKSVRKSFSMWLDSGYARSMSFVDFIKKIYSENEVA